MTQASAYDASVFMERFSKTMNEAFSEVLSSGQDVAVAVSGGPDSMALCYALAETVGEEACVHALTVDHRLRAEAAEEAAQVAGNLSTFPNIQHTTLTWQYEDKPDSRVQEQARSARYNLMAEYMSRHQITYLFTGHHMDDQAETFLFRLSKGSGLDGLAGMPYIAQAKEGMLICRPFLDFAKQDILKFCAAKGIDYALDPSNESEAFARVRLRHSMAALSEEGLTPKRLSVTAKRIGRARVALEYYAQKTFEGTVLINEQNRIVFNGSVLFSEPFDVVVRVVLMAMRKLQDQDEYGYGVRMEKIESLCEDLLKPNGFRKRTLGKVIFENDAQKGEFRMSSEHF